jgi:AcrR family transcriptional regulator
MRRSIIAALAELGSDPPTLPPSPMRSPPNPTRPPLRERKKQQVRERIVDRAYALFGARGFAAVTISDIVDAAEVSRSTFFRYFGDKQEVVFAYEQQFREALVAAAHAEPASSPDDLGTALEQLRTLVVGAYRTAAARPHSAVHERLIDANPELLDRHTRKLMLFAEDMAALLVARGAAPSIAGLAAHIAVACCLAARGDVDPGEMASAVGRRFDDVLEMGAPQSARPGARS